SSGTIEALAQDRFDLLADDLRPTEARQKRVRFLQFIISPARYITRYGNPKQIKTRLDLCGLRAATIPGHPHNAAYAKSNPQCKAAGKPELEQVVYTLGTQEYASVTNGQTDILLGGSSNLARFLKSHPNTVEVVLEAEANTEQGWVLNKQSTELAKALLAVM